MRLVSLRTIFGLVLAAVSAPAFVATPAVAGQNVPVPAVTIYPGDVIRENMLSDHEYPDGISITGYIDRRADLLGKVAKRTLLPGQAILTNAVGLPKLVTVGAMVRLVFQEGDLVITTYASALQGGSAGDIVSVRNLESGITLSGVVAPDGTIHVSNS